MHGAISESLLERLFKPVERLVDLATLVSESGEYSLTTIAEACTWVLSSTCYPCFTVALGRTMSLGEGRARGARSPCHEEQVQRVEHDQEIDNPDDTIEPLLTLRLVEGDSQAHQADRGEH